MVGVKICGITSLGDALAAVDSGANALGFVFADSPRQISPEKASFIIEKLPVFITSVGVFVNRSAVEMITIKSQCGLDLLQLHGDEPQKVALSLPGRVINAISVGRPNGPKTDDYPKNSILLDTYVRDIRGGSGHTFDWNYAAAVSSCRPIILAGGLDLDNISTAVAQVQPYAVDVSSGVESEPGVKNHDKLRQFIHRAKFSEIS